MYWNSLLPSGDRKGRSLGVVQPLPATPRYLFGHALQATKTLGYERASRGRIVKPHRLKGLLGHGGQEDSIRGWQYGSPYDDLQPSLGLKELRVRIPDMNQEIEVSLAATLRQSRNDLRPACLAVIWPADVEGLALLAEGEDLGAGRWVGIVEQAHGTADLWLGWKAEPFSIGGGALKQFAGECRFDVFQSNTAPSSSRNPSHRASLWYDRKKSLMPRQ